VTTGAPVTQRWRHRNARWQTRDELVETDRLAVAPIAESDAKRFVVEHHYSASYPASRLRYGLIDTKSDRLMGVCVLGVPMQARVLTGVFPDLEPYVQSLELSRLVLLDDPIVGANAESWMVSRVFRLAAATGLRGVVSFSDPQPRRRRDGSSVLPGHVGFVYQALGASYLGRSTSRVLTILSDGTVYSDRSMAKVRSGERGHEYAERQLVAHGATPRDAGGNPSEWLTRALSEIGARKIHHGGNHRYAWSIGHKGERTRIEPEKLAYPKSIDEEAA
jgi:hypothetical protein